MLLGESLLFRTIEELFDNIAENLFYPLEYTSSLYFEGSKPSSIRENSETLLGFWAIKGVCRFYDNESSIL